MKGGGCHDGDISQGSPARAVTHTIGSSTRDVYFHALAMTPWHILYFEVDSFVCSMRVSSHLGRAGGAQIVDVGRIQARV